MTGGTLFGRFSGSRSPRCGGLIKRAMHHLPSRNVTRKMLHRTPSETAYTSSSRYPKMAIFGQIKTRHPKNGRTSTLTVWGDLGTIFLVTTRLERWCLGSPLSTPGTPKSHRNRMSGKMTPFLTTCARLVHDLCTTSGRIQKKQSKRCLTRFREPGGVSRCPWHHLSSRVGTSKMVHSSPHDSTGIMFCAPHFCLIFAQIGLLEV